MTVRDRRNIGDSYVTDEPASETWIFRD
jgi:hypothetical protein